MNAKTKFGIGLICLGIIAFVSGSIKFKSQEEVFRVADFRASVATERSFPALRYVGVGLVAGGVVLVLTSRSRG